MSIIYQLPTFHHDEVVMPEKVLKTRVVTRNEKQVVQGLIQWSSLFEEEATWEDRSFILAQFPHFTASWRQEDPRGGYCKKRGIDKKKKRVEGKMRIEFWREIDLAV